ncbi:MAG: hypothetical protein WCJ25_00945 [Candidatus Moraniibacteriota bacterium]
MKNRKFFIGDILNLLFYDVNEEHELFLDDDRSEGIDDLLAFMLGLNTDPEPMGEQEHESEAEEYFKDDHRYSHAMQVCIESLCCQFPRFTERRFQNELRSLKKRVKRSCLAEEMEANWLTEQAKRYVTDRMKEGIWRRRTKRGVNGSGFFDDENDVTMLPVESIGYLYIPAGQERFDRVSSFQLFNDRPMNTN